VTNVQLALNGVFTALAPGDAIADAMAACGREAVATMPVGLATLLRSETPLLSHGTVGLEALRSMRQAETAEPTSSLPTASVAIPPGLDTLIADIAQAGRGVIMTMGKGGVGKTTIAAAIAISLARMGHRVTLSTTDPAAHIAAAVGEDVPRLTVTRIDPEQEVADYQNEVLAKAGSGLDAAGRAMLKEDLRSPCTEEIAVFRAFARTVDKGKDQFVVLDTAPTGHTILLLDATEAYHREVLRTQADMPDAVRNLLPRLRDRTFTKTLIITLAEATPVHEAERLQQDLARAGITPYAWIINQSLLASGTTDPLLVQRGRYEIPFIERVTSELAAHTALIAWTATLSGMRPDT
jgi:arsenite-transporting ATPase